MKNFQIKILNDDLQKHIANAFKTNSLSSSFLDEFWIKKIFIFIGQACHLSREEIEIEKYFVDILNI